MRRLAPNGKTAAAGGFTTVELIIVILVIAVLIAFLLPGMLSLVSDARLSNARQDAASIGAVIEILKIEGRFDPDDANICDLIYEMSGVEYGGRISNMDTAGGFVYSVTDGGATYTVRYDPVTGSVNEVGDV